MTSNFVSFNFNIYIIPLAFGVYPTKTNLADTGIHFVSNGVNYNW